MMSVLYKRCSEGSINSQEYKTFEIYAVTIKIHVSMTEYHHLKGKFSSGREGALASKFNYDFK